MVFGILDDDVLINVLCFCGIPGIIAVSKTCKYLHKLAFSQQIWIAVVQDLHARLFLDLPEDWSPTSLSTPSLVDLAKRAVCGPKSWSPQFHTRPNPGPSILSLIDRAKYIVRGQRPDSPAPKVTASYHIPFSANYRSFSQLLPGGKYVLLSGRSFKCWSLVQNECVWEYAPESQPIVQSWFQEFEAKMTDDGRAVVIIIYGISQAPFEAFIDGVHLDLTTKTSRTILHLTIPVPGGYFEDHVSHIKVCSNLAVARYGLTDILVMNLDTASHVILRGDMHPNILNVDCIPGYIIAIRKDSFRKIPQTSIDVWNTNAWPSNFWCHDSSELMRFWEISPEPIYREAISLPKDFQASTATISTHVSPLHPQSYTVWAQVRALAKRRYFPYSYVKRHTIIEYRLEPTTHQFSFRHISSRQMREYSLASQLRGVSFAGHTHLVRYTPLEAHYIMACGESEIARGDEIPLNLLRRPSQVIHVSAYSGALTISRPEGVTVLYFE